MNAFALPTTYEQLTERVRKLESRQDNTDKTLQIHLDGLTDLRQSLYVLTNNYGKRLSDLESAIRQTTDGLTGANEEIAKLASKALPALAAAQTESGRLATMTGKFSEILQEKKYEETVARLATVESQLTATTADLVHARGLINKLYGYSVRDLHTSLSSPALATPASDGWNIGDDPVPSAPAPVVDEDDYFDYDWEDDDDEDN